jgi:UPF0716 family protein affecting phage T7 exclusion
LAGRGQGSVGMGGFHGRNDGLRYRRARRLRANDRGIVSVVGTLLALLVFFALFGIFLTQYLPLWMTENESAFTAQAQQSAAELKSNIDFQVAARSPPVLATPFIMDSQGVPILAQPTSATLSFVPHLPGVFANVSTSVGPGNGQPFYQNFSLGTVQLTLPNRYFNPQTFEVEDDAVIQSQIQSNQILLYPPSLQVSITGNNTNLTLVLVQFYGNATQAVASGSEEVFTHFLSEQNYTVGGTGSTFSVTYAIGTHYRCSWATFMQKALPRSGLKLNTGYTLSPVMANYCGFDNGQAQDLTVTFPHINTLTLVVASIGVVVGVGVE